MKKNRLYLLGVCLLVGGLITTYLGYLNGAHNQVFIDNRGKIVLAEEGERKLHVEEKLSFSSIEIESDVLDIELFSAPEFSMDATYYSVIPIAYSVEDGILKVVANKNSSTINIGVSLGETSVLKIGVPEGLKLDALTINGNVGRIAVGALEADSVRLTSDVGEIDVTGLKTDAMEVRSATGSIRILDANFMKCAAHSNVGDVSLGLIGAREDYTLNLSTNIGSIDVAGANRSYRTYRGERLVDASTNVGSVKIDFADR